MGRALYWWLCLGLAVLIGALAFGVVAAPARPSKTIRLTAVVTKHHKVPGTFEGISVNLALRSGKKSAGEIKFPLCDPAGTIDQCIQGTASVRGVGHGTLALTWRTCTKSPGCLTKSGGGLLQGKPISCGPGCTMGNPLAHVEFKTPPLDRKLPKKFPVVISPRK